MSGGGINVSLVAAECPVSRSDNFDCIAEILVSRAKMRRRSLSFRRYGFGWAFELSIRLEPATAIFDFV